MHDHPLQEPDAPDVSVFQTFGSSPAFEEGSEYREDSRGGVLDDAVPTTKRA